jgi:hypothetical protein
MNHQTESGWVLNQLRVQLRQRNKVIAILAETELPTRQRRQWLTLFKRLSRIYRDCLYWAELREVLPPVKLASLWRAFVATGLATCDQQVMLVCTSLETSKLTLGQQYALCHVLASAMTLRRVFEGYKGEMFAVDSRQISSPH